MIVSMIALYNCRELTISQIDVTKSGRIFDFFVHSGWISKG